MAEFYEIPIDPDTLNDGDIFVFKLPIQMKEWLHKVQCKIEDHTDRDNDHENLEELSENEHHKS